MLEAGAHTSNYRDDIFNFMLIKPEESLSELHEEKPREESSLKGHHPHLYDTETLSLNTGTINRYSYIINHIWSNLTF